MTPNDNTPTNSNRSIRIFISSTFKDFEEERNLLVRQVFPSLRKKLKERFVELVDVDLRWGISQEQAEQYETLPICLVEIDRSRPFFIGLLGERYGWVPPEEAYTQNLLEQHDWLTHHKGNKSVTELEILHGVLNNPEMAGRAFFYFRSASYVKNKGGEYLSSSKEDAERQRALKTSIINSPFPVIKYKTPESLAKHLERDLWKVINVAFPSDAIPDTFDRENRKHEAYALPRRRLYFGGQNYITAIDNAIKSNKQRILIEGASGAGKSALIANWLETHKQNHSEDLCHVHYLSASADSASTFNLTLRLCESIKRLTENNKEIASNPQALYDDLPLWLSIASNYANQNNTRWLFVLDALNNLTDLRDLRWFPEFLPSQIHFVISCLHGDINEALKQKGECEVITVNPLSLIESEYLLVEYLKKYNKILPANLLQKILNHTLVDNPLFLKSLAEELRLFGQHDTLEKQLDGYLNSKSIDDLFQHIIKRVEIDCDKTIVKQCLQTLWCSRAGLSEKEILKINTITPSKWAQIRNALDEALIDSNGRINFAHDYIKLAIKKRYLNSSKLEKTAHKNLALWFQAQPADARRLEEEPYQWQQAEAWISLKNCLVHKEVFFVKPYQEDQALFNYWLTLQEKTSFTVEASYRKAWKHWSKDAQDSELENLALSLQQFLSFSGSVSQFNLSLAKQTATFCENNNSPLLNESLNNLARLHKDRGEYKIAENLFKKILLNTKKQPLNSQIKRSVLNNLASVQKDIGEYSKAHRLFQKELFFLEKTLGPNHLATWTSINNLAEVLCTLGEYSKAEELNLRALNIAEKVLGSEHLDTATSLSNLAIVLADTGNLNEAESLLQRALTITEKNLGPNHQDTANRLFNLAAVLQDNENYEKAEALYRQALSIIETSLGPNHPTVASYLNGLGTLFDNKGDDENAESYFRQAITIIENAFEGDHPELISPLGNLANILVDKNENIVAETYNVATLSRTHNLK